MSETTIDFNRALGNLVRERPAYANVLESFNIDYCCGGDQSLADACRERDFTVEELRDELEAAAQRGANVEGDWDGLDELADLIIETHHDYLREELPELRDLVETVSRVHGENHPELHTIEEVFPALAEEMRDHIEEEEEDGFPIIRKLARGESLTESERARLQDELKHYEDDHEETAEYLDRIAELTNGYEVPADACPTYEATLSRLEALEEDTHMHVHRENNVLFEEAKTLLKAQG
ncbi:iron-sulfur cluster repair di-iron protein [Halovenus halobia]|uniref:iron-sulfur cluster repair di-iron protein n=1 Tax=Halovenus halobia TaxID=3396622 RepID=UPI003F56513A